MLKIIFWLLTVVVGIVHGTMLVNNSAPGDVDNVILAVRIIFFTFFSLEILRRSINGVGILLILFLFIVSSVLILDRYLEIVFIPWWIAICAYLHLPFAKLRTSGFENSRSGKPN